MIAARHTHPEAFTAELVSVVVGAYRRRLRLVPEYHAWVAARDAVRRHLPELGEHEAGLLATRIIAAETALEPGTDGDAA